MTKLCPDWNFTINHQSYEDGRILLIWKSPIKVCIVHQTSQCITCLIEFPDKEPFYYSGVYASNLAADRVDLWEELIYLKDTFDLDNNRWFVGGDFSQIMIPAEHSSPSVCYQDYQMSQFQDSLSLNLVSLICYTTGLATH